jgi:hypothetical protein
MRKEHVPVLAVLLWAFHAATPLTVALSASQEAINVRIKVSVEGMAALPEESSIQLKGLDACATLARHGSLDAEGETTFSGVPVCKVMLKILITGLDAKILPSVDLAAYRSAPMRIQIKSSGPPIVD